MSEWADCVSLLIFVLVYFLVFGMGIYYMLKMMKRGPEEHVDRPESRQHPLLRNRALDALDAPTTLERE